MFFVVFIVFFVVICIFVVVVIDAIAIVFYLMKTNTCCQLHKRNIYFLYELKSFKAQAKLWFYKKKIIFWFKMKKSCWCLSLSTKMATKAALDVPWVWHFSFLIKTMHTSWFFHQSKKRLFLSDLKKSIKTQDCNVISNANAISFSN